MIFEPFVVFEVPQVNLPENLVESDVFVGVLLDDVRVCLLKIVPNVPHV
jgi:hypothetical protein